MPDVFESPVATTKVAGLRGKHRAAYYDFVSDLARRGCKAMDYRVTGDGLDHLCVRHLSRAWRVVVAFAEHDVAWVVLVGQHVSDPNSNVYELLYRLLDVQPDPQEKRRKPPCCNNNDEPPATDEEMIDALTRRSREVIGHKR